MGDRGNHYEAAFEAYLRHRRRPCVCVDEARRALSAHADLKNFDFVVYSGGGRNLLVDVKGRRATRDAPLQTWATRRDVDDLSEWQRVFGDGFAGLFAFVFEVDPMLTRPHGHFAADDGPLAGRHYLMLGVGLDDYRAHMRPRSTKWDTVSLPAATFRDLSRPIDAWL